MLPRPAALLALALLTGWPFPARAQQPVQPGTGNEPVPLPILTTTQTTSEMPPTPAFTTTPEPCPPDPKPFRPPPGWFASVEVFLPRPYVANVDSSTDGYEPVPNLDLSVSPQATLGYRFDWGNALLLSYRYLGSSGNNSDWWGDWHARLDSHWIDLDYRGCLHGPWKGFTFQWQTGGRVAVVEHDVRNLFSGWWSDDRMSFVGAGAHIGIDVNWYLRESALGLFGRADVGLLLGQSAERYQSVFQDVNGPNPYQNTTVRTVGQLNVRAELGLSWTPPTRRWLRFEAGCQLFDFLWEGENFANVGPFVRCEIGF
jgi:hypothetical protein